MCRPGPVARYVSTTVLHHGIIHSSIAITITGGSDLMLFLRERQRNDQMMELMKTALDQITEERRQAEERAAEERRIAAAERQAFLEALNRLTEAITQNGRGSQ